MECCYVKLVETGVRRYKTGLSEVEKVLLNDLQTERKYLIDLKNTFGLSYIEDEDEIEGATQNAISFI